MTQFYSLNLSWN